MSSTLRANAPSTRLDAILTSPAPHASERVHVAHSTRTADAPSWARIQVGRRVVTDLLIVLIVGAATPILGSLLGLDATRLGTREFVIAGLFAVAWFLALRIRRTSELRTIGQGTGAGRVVVATLAAFGSLAVVHSFVEIDGVRAYFLIGLPLGTLLLLVGRAFWLRRLEADRSVGLSLPRVLIVGSGADIDFVAERLTSAPKPQYVVAGVVFSDGLPESDAVTSTGFPAFDGIDAVVDALSIANADVVIVAGHPGDGGEFVQALAWRLESTSAELVIAWCVDSVEGSRMRFDTTNGMPLTHISTATFAGGKYAAKRVMDVVLAGGALLMLAPLFAVIALMVKADSKGSVFFRQERVGVDGSRFHMVKFRSMVATAESDLAELLAQNEGNGVLFKLRADPRVTRIGAILRRYSLDELPQLWNIFVGDMSIVGPRPPLAREVEQYDDRSQRRMYIKPGLTGAWQVGGRSDLSWEQSIRLDLHYVENWSLLGDLRIIWRTVGVVIRPVGAY